MYREVEVYCHVIKPVHEMNIRGQLRASAPLPPGKMNMRPSGPQSWFEGFREEKLSFHLRGIEPRYHGLPARKLIVAE